ncbi:MAG: stage II sporulation protein D [Anaerovoracaceae bacterium]
MRRRRTGFSGRLICRQRGRRRYAGRGYKFFNILSVCVFAAAVSIYGLTNLPEAEEGGDVSVFQGIGSLADQVKELYSGSDAQQPAGNVTLSQLSGMSDLEIKVLDDDSGKIAEVPLEEYVACVVASEMPSDFETEALKAQAVAARTYASARKQEFEAGKCSHYDEGAYVCNTTHCQVYRTEEGLREVKGDEWMEKNFPKILSAVYETAGEVLYYDGSLVEQPLFFSSGGERTENSEDVFVSAIPYLRSVESGAYEEESPHKDVEVTVTMEDVKSKVSAVYGAEAGQSVTAETIQVVSRTDGGAVAEMKMGNLELTGRQVRSLFGLASADFEVNIGNGEVTFVTSGSGHRVGLSQYGANGMAKQGKTYREILEHYYSGVEVKKQK